MHGRLKVKTTAEQQAEKEKERAKKLQLYNAGWSSAIIKRQKGEFDSEALETTSHLLLGNPDLYTMWNNRKEILSALKTEKETSDFQLLMNNELSFTEHCLRINHKSYGSWQQRVWTLENMPEPNWQRELQLCNKYLELDERNFHCWDYRRYIVQRADVAPQVELEFSDDKISSNFSNYSSWHYRSKLLPKIYPDSEGRRPIAEEKLLQEFELVQNAAFTDPNDQSAWFYHRWLLGRGKQPLQPVYVYASFDSNPFVIVAFNCPISYSDLQAFAGVTVNDVQQDVMWSLPGSWADDHCPVWIGKCIPGPTKSDAAGDYRIMVNYKRPNDIRDASFGHLRRQGEAESWSLQPDSWMNFSIELSAATSSVLSAELESCVQLQELEPDCKWPLLTSILLMKSLDFEQYREQILQNFDKLLAVDPCRENYYHDLRSKFLLENEVRILCGNAGETELNMSGHRLTVFYHQEYFLQLKVLNLSDNCLTSLRGIGLLLCLETLVVDRNRLANLDGLQGLTKLKALSVQSNFIVDFGCFEQLAQLPSLVCLELSGNEICGREDYEQRIKEIVTLCSLEIKN